jgi:DNA helicase-2/ATP-dependent DNA helicase PcrA
MDLFSTFYKKLNKEQKRAVDSIEGPVMVIAGPGTGKTQILTLRIANILKKTDMSPDNILALTFTDSGVFSMRKRLVEIIGNAAYQVGIFTFHGFCNFVIQSYPEKFPNIIGSSPIAELDKIEMVEAIIERVELKKIKPFGDKFYYVGSAIKAIQDLKKDNISPEEFLKTIKSAKKLVEGTDDLYHVGGPHKGKMKTKYQDELADIEKNTELALVYSEYQLELRKNKLYDFEDMIVEVVVALKKDGDLLLRLQEQYQYVLADEHQDANDAQNQILELLCNYHKSPNVFIVGDEKQAIFAFQGASLENFLYFQKVYEDTKVIFLEENYRSTQPVLDASFGLVSGTKDVRLVNLRRRLKSNIDAKPFPVKVYGFSSSRDELLFLAEDIKKTIASGVCSEEIAVLHRDNKDALDIADILGKSGVSFSIESDQNVLEDDDIKKLIYIFRATADVNNVESFIRALHADFLDIDDTYIYKLASDFSSKKRQLDNFVQQGDVGDRNEVSALKMAENIKKWHKISLNNDVVYLFETVVRESGLLAHLLSLPGSAEKIDKLNVLFSNIKSIISQHKDFNLNDFLGYIDHLKEKNIVVRKKQATEIEGAVKIMTAHKSKGREFSHVYIVMAQEGHWGGRRSRNLFKLPLRGAILSEDKDDDERRLFYVALTRAKHSVKITYSKTDLSGESKLPSKFIYEMDQGHCEFVNTEEIEKAQKKLAHTFYAKKSGEIAVNNKDFVRQLFDSRGLSVTALNNYLQCPWKYFYNNLLRLPSAMVKEAAYGVAIHSSLKYLFDRLRQDEKWSQKDTLKIFSNSLSAEPLTQKDFNECLVRGEMSISGYIERYKDSWNKNTLNELNVSGVIVGDVPLVGKLDKVEFLDGDLNVNVVDYKTGKPKSRNVIEGKTKNSDGNYKRQLVFYKILLDGFDKGKYKMVSGEIDFVEPDDGGNYHKEQFVVDGDDKTELENTIKRVAKEIRDLSFWDARCDDKACSFCELRNVSK